MTETVCDDVASYVQPPLANGDSLEDELWRTFWERRDRASRNDLVIAYESIVDHVVYRLPLSIQGYWDKDDLKSFGVLGLIEAIDHFEKDSLIYRFRSYASLRVRGAIFDELRHLDWLPRNVRRRVISYRTAVDALSHELRRSPSADEVFTSLNVSPADGAALLAEVRSAQLLHLDHSSSPDGDGDGERVVERIAHAREAEPEAQLLASERFAELKEAIAELPERQRTVVSLHFLSNLTQRQIGQMLGISSSRVCQIESSAIQALRRVLDRADISQAG
jgi:RNA polymerase sigma factor FliA